MAEIDASRIDAWNIYQASRQAMVAAVSQLDPLPDYLLLDAMEIDLPIEQKALIHGDARSVSIAAASILAKIERDRRMEEFDQHVSACMAWRSTKATARRSIWKLFVATGLPRCTGFPTRLCVSRPAGRPEQHRIPCR